ncbi:MAG TPA: tape measure protein [Aquabacterium sp.]|nr:tape measure protein [Aquabacterium sp.]
MRGAVQTTRAAAVTMGAAMTAGITAPLLGTGTMAISAAATMEQAEVAFSTMLQSETKGLQMVKDLIQFAAATPLTTPEVTAAARTLLQFGVEGERVIDTLRMLGDAAGGDSQRFQSMALAFGQMSAAGRLMGQDLLQMINAGFNPLQEMSRTTGKSMAVLKKEMEDGKISSAMVTAAFRSATSQGGRFFQMMEKQSQTVTGLWSTMRDNVSIFMVTLGNMIIKQLHVKDAIQAVSSAAGKFGDWIKSLGPTAQRTLLAVTLIASGLGPLLIVLGAVGPAVLAGFGILTTVVLPIVAVVAALTAGVWLYVKSVGGVGPAWERVKAIAVNAWNAIKSAALAAWGWLQGSWGTIWSWLAPLFAGAAIEIMGTFMLVQGAVGLAVAAFQRLREVMTGEKVSAIKPWIDAILTLIGRVGMAVLITKGFMAVLGLLKGVLSALGVTQLVVSAATTAWWAITMAVKVAMAFLGAVIASVSAAMLVANGVNVLWNATLAVTYGLLAVAMVAGAIALAGAIYGLYRAGQVLMETLGNLATTNVGTHLSGVFNEWKAILGDIIGQLMSGDFSGAWERMQSAGALAFSQVKDMWPSLWTFIKGGFTELWTIVSTTFVTEMQRGIIKATVAASQWIASWDPLGVTGLSTMAAAVTTMMGSWEAELSKNDNIVNRSATNLQNMANGFSVVESEATRAARAFDEDTRAYHEFLRQSEEMGRLTEDEQWYQDFLRQSEEFAKLPGQTIGQQMGDGIKKHVKSGLDDAFAIFGSSRHLAQVEAWREKYRDMVGRVNVPAATQTAQNALNTAAPTAESIAANDALWEMADVSNDDLWQLAEIGGIQQATVDEHVEREQAESLIAIAAHTSAMAAYFESMRDKSISFEGVDLE